MKKIRILLLIIPFILTGCYDYKAINTLAFIGATEINKIDNEYIVTAQAINPQAPDKTTTVQSPFIIYTGKGKTLQESYRSIEEVSSRYLYSNHLQLLIINENIAKKDITQIIDFFVRNPAIRTEFYVAIGKSDNILEVITPIDEISSSSIKNSIENNSKYLGTISKVTFNDLTNMVLNPNLEIILPTIKLIEENNEKEKHNINNTNDTSISLENTEETIVKTKYELDGLAIFKDNKLIGYLDKEQSKHYNIIKNNINNTIINYECEKDKYLTLEITESDSKYKIKNNDITININLKGNINETHCNISVNNTKSIKKLEDSISTYLNKILENEINNNKIKYNSDIYGFLDLYYKKNYDYYTKINSSWYDSSYINTKIKVNSKIKIIGKGNTLEVINEKNK